MLLRTLPYRYYKNYFYPYIEDKRGATRLLALLGKISRIGIEKVDEGDAESVFERGDWDNLVILDACRHDLYEQVNGPTDSRISVGSGTIKYLNRTYSSGDYSDIVYIAGNPFLSKEKFRKFTGRDVNEVFHEVFHTYSTDWDEENGTVLPEPLVRDAVTTEELFPGKRKIVHFMQPHCPFVKSDKSYRGNLEYVMPYVEELVDKLEGKTIITSDHGNMIGENGLYGHPAETLVKPLRKVPWDVRE